MATQLASRLMALPWESVSWLNEVEGIEGDAYLGVTGLAASSDVGTASLLDGDGDYYNG
jgi:hypothetical protein